MKNFLKVAVALAATFAVLCFSSCSDRIVPTGQLPAHALSFIEEFFPGNEISYVKAERELFHITYDVRLTDGTTIEFNDKGEWDNVDCQYRSVPSALVPESIADYVQNQFPGQPIVKIDKEPFGYEIELANDLELTFDKNGRLRHIDD